MKTMKKALMMVLSLAACGGKTDNGGNSDNNGSGGKDQPAAVDMTAQEVLDALKEKLGDSYGCDLAEDESRMTGYYVRVSVLPCGKACRSSWVRPSSCLLPRAPLR